ncbi:S-adenosyl-L-methionine-dependent methyltransferase [Parathielavia appendiculata]|uniref:S-adenosyl-L-methionine-dependent methyltransferase n=1 Tax=Parathielavia appendiculata TaxID=2587402 RepID=A0AAN6TXK0_9PEZI|nr:S-adenosyl-L-methionine-dependent methyltransferase [Parathielavia appendiculata]
MTSKQTNGALGKGFPLEELSWTITKNASIVSQYLDANHLPQPSLDADGPSTILPNDSPRGIQQARQRLISASLEILQLAIGPSEFLPNLSTSNAEFEVDRNAHHSPKFQYISCLDWLCRFRIFHLVPLTGIPISYADLAVAAGVPERRLISIARMAMTNAVFREQDGGTHIMHSAISALLARNENVYAYATYMCSRSALMAMHLGAAHQRWGPATVRPYETAYNVAFDTDLPFFDHISRDETKMREFAAYMKNVRSSDAMHLKHLVSGFRWRDIPDGGIVVDVGGSTGSSAIALAEAFPHLTFIVQDLPANAENGRKSAAKTHPESITSRLSFQGHDFTKPQPVHGADVYLLRMILHDWPDDKAAEVVRNIVAAMDVKKSRLLIMETMLPEPGSVPISVERIVRARDLTMMQAFNSKERSLDDFEYLLGLADPRAKLVGVVQPLGSAMSVLEVALDPERGMEEGTVA